MSNQIVVQLPKLHAGQKRIWKARTLRNAVRCGRRFGKTKMMSTIACDHAVDGLRVGLFAPEHRQLQEPYEEIHDILMPVRKRASKTEGTIRTLKNGVVDFWTLNDNELAGRGREYDIVMIDEGAFTKNGQMMGIWDKSIKPTMLTTRGSAWVFSTPNGDDPQNFFYALCNDPKHGFVEFHAPSVDNPYVDPLEIEKERLNNNPLVFRQEYLAEFVDWSGAAFFSLDKLTVNGQPLILPDNYACDAVFAVIDSATKAGKEHDGTAVVFCAQNNVYGAPLVIIDWDIIQIEGALLETWLPTVFEKLEFYAAKYRARSGSLGTWIEDKASGMVLNQQAQRNGWPSRAIDSKLTSVGKEERAISVSGYVWREQVKIAVDAFGKVVSFKGNTRNHLISQVIGFRIGQKDQADDLLDCFCYSIALALGNNEGF